jgi:LysM repeat protein
MSRRSVLGFILLNVLVTLVTVFAIIGIWTRLAPQPTRLPSLSMPPIIITATIDPKSTQVVYVVVTATPSQNNGTAQGNQAPTPGISTTASAEVASVPTLDPTLLPPGMGPTNTLTPGPTTNPLITPVGSDVPVESSPSATAQGGCPTYSIKKGDTAGSIAETYGVAVADLMRANNLTERDLTRLQIGQVLIIPVNGCGLATEEPTPTPTRFVIPTLPPTVTLVPTASSAQVEIVQVIGAGDITSEAVEIRNSSGGVIQMQGWQMTDLKGKIFIFPEFRIMPGGRVTIFTREGNNTPIVLYWGQPRAVWTDPNQEIVIIDSQGAVQVRRTVSGAPLVATDQSGFTPTETRTP